MKKDSGVREGRTGLSRLGAAAIVTGMVIAMSAGWMGAWAQGCDYDAPAWAGGITKDKVISAPASVIYNDATARCVFIKGMPPSDQAHSTFLNISSNDIIVNGQPGAQFNYNNDALNRLDKMDGGYYIYVPSGKYLGIEGAITGDPVCSNPIPYTITFNINYTGGTNPPSATTSASGTLASLPAPTRDGYTLAGWYTVAAATGGNLVTTSTKFTANTTIYARWTATSYTITYTLDGGTVTPANPANYTIETAAFTLRNPTKTGYTFDGWTGSNGTIAQTTVTIPQGSTGNKNYTAKWTADTPTPTGYIITFNINYTGGTNPQPATTSAAGTLASLPNPTRTGYTLDGWFSAATGGNLVTTSTVFTANATIYAHWTQDTPTPSIITITFNANGGTVTPTSGTIGTDGKLATIPTPTRAGFTFNGWYTAATGGNEVNTSTVFTANATIYAHWTAVPVAPIIVTFNANGGVVSPDSAQVNSNGTLTTLPMPTYEGHTFKGWFTTRNSTNEITTSTRFFENTTIYAQWTPVSLTALTITFDANGGTVSPSWALTDADSTLATLPTPTRTDYTFIGWFTLATGGSEVNVGTKFSNDATIYAHWASASQNAFTITFDANGGTVSPSSAQTRADSTLATLPTPTREGFAFVGWSTALNGNNMVTDGHKFSASTTIYAKWTETTAPLAIFTITFNPNSGTVSQTSAQTGEDSTLAALPVPTRDGHSFDGWFTAATGGNEVTINTKFSANATIYAHWTTASQNIAVIDNVLFVDSSGNFRFSVVYHLTENKNNHTLKYIVTLDSAGTVVFLSSRDPSPIKASMANDKDTLKINISDPLFDTTYWVHIHTVDNSGHPGEEKSVKSVRSGPFTHQVIWVAPGSSKFADNNNFKLDAVRWSSVSASIGIKVEPSVTPSESDLQNAGFIPVGEYGYTYSFVTPADATLPLVAANISIRADVPEGYSTDKVKLYRWNGTYWEVAFDTRHESGYFTGTAIDSVSKDVGKTYRLMINTVKPVVSNFQDPNNQDWVRSDGQISNASFAVSTRMGNVGNFRVSVLTGPAKDSTKLDTARIISNPSNGISRNVTFSIGPEVVGESGNFGVLAFIIVNGGNGDTAINYSYRVKSTRYGGFTASTQLKDKKKWFPFAAQVELTNDAVKAVLEPALYKGEDKIGVHDTLYRLFRYNKTAADLAGNANGWIEYNPDNNDAMFEMKPGRLMWFKTSVPGAIFNFGEAMSISLRNVFEITLPPNQWTDIALPFRFDVCLGDIKDAMADEWGQLEFYRWEGGDPRFVARVLNSPTASYDSTVLKGNVEPFTVFNKNQNRSVTLRIPPIPAFLSSHYKTVNGRRATALAKTTAGARYETNGAWHYTLHATANGYEVSDLLVGYHATDWAFAVPPSFGEESVVLVGDDGTEMGHHFGPSIASGSTYKLRFYNDGAQRTAFKFSAKPSADIPISARVTFVKASTGEILGGGSNGNSEYGITVAGMSHEDVFMIIGSSGYRARAASANAGAKFTIGRINVNMSARSARISYYVPESGINQVEVSIYDIKGRQVWRTSQTAKAAAWNVVEWNSRGSRWGAASNGLYIVRIKATGTGGTAGVATKRIMFSR
ncbi:MAG: InlB B-repeat-containing protein [Chitinispirillales bacterium]|jgi:uncharacterized repeat protein (TIGR02543 family)|nr:InlB B-repeat-containing protein [Chitinispirillales bacterium]